MTDTLSGKTPALGKVFLKYLFSSIGSAVVVSVYSIVDCIMVGQYEGPRGTAALAVITPVWTIIISLGLLFGIGGSVIFAKLRGEGKLKDSNEIFTLTVISAAVVTAVAWAAIAFADAPLLRLSGADDDILPLARDYLKWLKFVVPLFSFGQVFAAFLRNDGAPALAMIATVSGGLFNIVGDYLLVFTADMGIEGAGLSTGLGQVLAFCIMCSHFFGKRNTLRLVRPTNVAKNIRRIAATGFPSFIVDIAVGILAIIFNNQIMKYLGSTALSIYGVIVNINLVAQYVAYGVGQAIQPLVSRSYGARETGPIAKTFGYGLLSAGVVAVLFCAVCEAVPLPIMKAFMTVTDEIAAAAPTAVRIYSLSYLFLPLNIFATYYLQSIMRAKASFTISLLRGFILSAAFAYLFPVIFGAQSLWYATFASEAVTLILSAVLVIRYSAKLKRDLSDPSPETVATGNETIPSDSALSENMSENVFEPSERAEKTKAEPSLPTAADQPPSLRNTDGKDSSERNNDRTQNND